MDGNLWAETCGHQLDESPISNHFAVDLMLLCERVLGPRPVALLRGEARVGRIGLRHLHALAAVLGVDHPSHRHNDNNDDDAEARAK